MLENTHGYSLSCASPRTSPPSVALSMWTKLDCHFSCESAVKATLLPVQLLVGEETMKIYRTGHLVNVLLSSPVPFCFFRTSLMPYAGIIPSTGRRSNVLGPGGPHFESYCTKTTRQVFPLCSFACVRLVQFVVQESQTQSLKRNPHARLEISTEGSKCLRLQERDRYCRWRKLLRFALHVPQSICLLEGP